MAVKKKYTFWVLSTIRFTEAGGKGRAKTQRHVLIISPGEMVNYTLQINFLWDINTLEIFLRRREFWGKEISDREIGRDIDRQIQI